MERAMRDSGIEQIGQIPSDWECVQISRVLEKSAEGIMVGPFGSSLTNAVVGPDEGEYKIYGQANLIRRDFNYGDKYVTKAKYNELRNYEVLPGDIAVSMMGTIGKCRVVPKGIREGIMDSHLIKLRLDKQMNPIFFEYAYESLAIFEQIMARSKGSIMTGLNSSIVKSLYIPLPAIAEQSAIASYLDDKVVQIDTLIAEAKASIEEYKAWKASIIYEAVTKGLDPGVEMKDSGVEWIGEIPSHWEAKRFKYVATVKSNLVDPQGYLKYPQVAPDNIEKGSGKLLTCKSVEESGVISGNHLFYKGQILYSKIRPLLNKVTIAPFDGLCSADMYPIEAIENTQFLVYVMLSEYFLQQVGLFIADRVKMPKINQEELAEIMVVVPPREEQNNIECFLHEKCDEIDSLISEKESLITDLEAYKKSLIFEVVTGKRKVG